MRTAILLALGALVCCIGLDASAVHPEAYGVARQIVSSCGRDIRSLMGDTTKLRALKPDLAETKIYVDPPGWGGTVGHAFDRRVDPVTLERLDTPEQIDSWNRIWQFFNWWLRPSEDRSKPPAPVRVQP